MFTLILKIKIMLYNENAEKLMNYSGKKEKLGRHSLSVGPFGKLTYSKWSLNTLIILESSF